MEEKKHNKDKKILFKEIKQKLKKEISKNIKTKKKELKEKMKDKEYIKDLQYNEFFSDLIEKKNLEIDNEIHKIIEDEIL